MTVRYIGAAQAEGRSGTRRYSRRAANSPALFKIIDRFVTENLLFAEKG